MICWIRHFRVYFLIVALGCLNACDDISHVDKGPKTIPLPTSDELVSKPLNCPAILTARTYKKWKTDQVWLRFQIEHNKNYEPNLGDACRGDIKNLWRDLNRFDPIIEEYTPKLAHISGMFEPNLNRFPVTTKKLKNFVNNRATEISFTESLKTYNRSTLEGGLEIQRASRQFLMKALQEYLDQEHKPIIEAYLNEHGLKMGRYSGEKLQFCYKSFNRCSKYVEFNQSANLNDELDFEFFGAWSGGWKFEHDKQGKTD